jgi:hypothetical protein
VLCSHAHDSFEFRKRSQLFIRSHNEPLSVAAMRVNDEDRPLESIAETPSDILFFAQI